MGERREIDSRVIIVAAAQMEQSIQEPVKTNYCHYITIHLLALERKLIRIYLIQVSS